MRLRQLSLAAALALCLSNVFAADAASDPNIDLGKLLYDQMDAMCPSMVEGLLSRGDFTPVLKNRPIDVAAVCKCSQSKMEADTRFKKHLNVPASTAKETMDSETLRAYFIGRVLSSVFPCLSTDLDKSLAATSLDNLDKK